MDLDGLLDDATRARLERAQAGEDVSRRLRLAALEPGEVGVVEAQVVHVAAPRAFQRRNGTSGLVARVGLQDATGEVDLVLWDDEVRHVREGTLAPGAAVRLRGAQVKAGYRGGVELALGPAVIEARAAPAEAVEGRIVALADTQVIEGRFQAEVDLETAAGPARVVLWDEAVKLVRGAGPGAKVRLEGATPHPLLEGCYLADGARVTVLGGPGPLAQP